MTNPPLAERMRPQLLEEYIGQQHLVGPKGVLLKTLQNKLIPSIIFWGPPGVGKTTLANIIANQLGRPFYTLSAINSGVKEVRSVIEKAGSLGLFGKDTPILFIDEIHRFSKSTTRLTFRSCGERSCYTYWCYDRKPFFRSNFCFTF